MRPMTSVYKFKNKSAQNWQEVVSIFYRKSVTVHRNIKQLILKSYLIFSLAVSIEHKKTQQKQQLEKKLE